MNPLVVHVVRPYPNEQAYLAAEAWSIEPRSMLLIDADPLAADTAVSFDVALADGQKPIRAEGRVVEVVRPKDDRPGGVRVRFKRFGPATKAFIERAVSAHAPRAAETADVTPALSTTVTAPEPLSDVTPFTPPLPAELATRAANSPSGVRPRSPGPVAAPANRDDLLKRLRHRRGQAG